MKKKQLLSAGTGLTFMMLSTGFAQQSKDGIPPDIRLPQQPSYPAVLLNPSLSGYAPPRLDSAALAPAAKDGISPNLPRWSTRPRVIKQVDPTYSDEARKAKKQGTVTLELTVTKEGLPQNIRVTRSVGLGLDEKAVEAMREWRFEPATKDGIPIDVVIHVYMAFRSF